jgi:hypothetical protein
MNRVSPARNARPREPAYAAAVAVQGATGRVAITGALVSLGVAGIAAAASPGRLTSSDPAWWLLGMLAVGALTVLLVAAAVLLLRHPKPARDPRERRERAKIPPPTLVIFLVLAAAAFAWAAADLGGVGPPPVQPPLPKRPAAARPALHGGTGGANVGPWLAIVLGLLIVAGLAAVWIAQLRARRAVAPAELVPGDPLAAAVEAALIDLEGETDPRRAVIKAYARTEAVLREHGLPRRPAEAPLEYLDRVLRDLGARAGAVDRLTELFERAAFSQHAVGTDMRDEAVAVFHGLRDELAAETAEP